jgi:hypothetical protein
MHILFLFANIEVYLSELQSRELTSTCFVHVVNMLQLNSVFSNHMLEFLKPVLKLCFINFLTCCFDILGNL